MKKILAGLTALAAAVTLAAPVSAQDYPTRPVSLMVSYAPGGATDFQARIVTMVATNEEYLGQPIVIINKPGAGGKVGWNDFAENAAKDGYELAAYNVPHFIAQSIQSETKYDIDNLEPIANWGSDPAVLMVGKDSQFNSLDDLVNFAKENPGKVTINGAGLFVGHHIAFLQLQKATGAEFTYVPEQGGAPGLKSVMGGQVMAGINNLSDAYRSQDSLKILAIADLERNTEFLPDVPTFKEQGYDVDDSSVNFRGIMAPKGTPPEVIEKLAKAVPAMFQDDAVKKQMAAGGSPLRIMGREEVQEMWKKRKEYLSELLKGL